MLLTACNVEPNWLEMIMNMSDSICSVLNIALLIYFTRKEWKISKERDKETHTENLEIAKLDRQKLWYDKIVIERLLDNILHFYDEIYDCMVATKIVNQTEKKEAIKKVNNILSQYKRVITPCLKLFSNELAQNIIRQMQDFQDYLINEIESRQVVSKFCLESKMNENKSNILKAVYDYDFKCNLKHEQ